MRRLLVVGLTLLAILLINAMPVNLTEQTGRTIVIAVDLAHGERDRYLGYIQGNITSVTIDGVTYPIQWINITPGMSITSELLANVDILLIGQPTVSFTPEEMDAIKNWLLSGDKVLYIAGDSDYGGGPASIDAVNTLLEYLGSKLRLEHAGVYTYVNDTYTYKGVDYPTAAAAYYRVIAFVEPDNVPELYTSMVEEDITKPIIMHGPTCVIWVDETGTYRDPVNETYPELIRLVWYRRAYIGDNNPPAPYLYDPLIYGEGTRESFVAYAAEYYASRNTMIVVAGESLYGDYEPAWSSYYYGVELDGPKFVTNLVKWWVKIITRSVLRLTDPEGDDKGPGTLMYPTNPVFVPGAFDIVKFQVLEDDNFIYLRTTVKDYGGNPWNGPNGFSLQLIHVYILTTATTLPVNETAPGLNVRVYPGWHYLAVAAPGWGGVPWPDGEAGALYASNGTLITGEGDLFDVYYAGDNSIDIKISKTLLVDVENLENWMFAVAVTSYDGYGPMKVRPIVAGDPTEWNLGGGDAIAIAKGVQPLVVDFLAPTAEDQYQALSSYNPETGVLAYIFAMSKIGPVTPTPTPTPTPPPEIRIELIAGIVVAAIVIIAIIILATRRRK